MAGNSIYTFGLKVNVVNSEVIVEPLDLFINECFRYPSTCFNLPLDCKLLVQSFGVPITSPTLKHLCLFAFELRSNIPDCCRSQYAMAVPIAILAWHTEVSRLWRGLSTWSSDDLVNHFVRW